MGRAAQRGFSRAQVLDAYARVERKFRALLVSADPVIIRTQIRSRGTSSFYQMRVGTNTRAGAQKLCADLIAKGGPCMVLRNSRGYSLRRRAGEKKKL